MRCVNSGAAWEKEQWKSLLNVKLQAKIMLDFRGNWTENNKDNIIMFYRSVAVTQISGCTWNTVGTAGHLEIDNTELDQ